MPAITGLGHVGLYCSDLAAQSEFYTEVLGLTKTDEDLGRGMVFLSARPDVEHHELLLCTGRDVGSNAHVVQQVSFRCASLEDVTAFYRRFQERSVKLDRVISHGNAIGVYFFDPEGNRCEVYWQTGLLAHQPFAQPVDLEDDPEVILAAIAESVERYGATGTVDAALLRSQDVGATS